LDTENKGWLFRTKEKLGVKSAPVVMSVIANNRPGYAIFFAMRDS